MASSSSSSHLSIDDRIHQLEREIKDVADDIQKNRNTLKQSSDDNKFLQSLILNLQKDKDLLHQEKLLLLQQRPQQQQQEAGKTASYDELYFISYGTRMTITIIGCHDHLTLLMSVFVCLSVSIVYNHDDLHSALLCQCHIIPRPDPSFPHPSFYPTICLSIPIIHL